MDVGLPPVDVIHWCLAISPIVLLVALVLKSRLGTTVDALITVVAAGLVAVAAFGAGSDVLGVALGKGVWTGIWILFVIWPALLLFHLARRVGLDRMGPVLTSILPARTENIMIVAWIFPSFVQGVAGFGTPVAVAAPLLVSMGVRPVKAVALTLVGYHWSVTFGSMGSSFYIGALTGGLTSGEIGRYADAAALILGINVLVSGVLVALMSGGWKALREAAVMITVAGSTMAVTLYGAVQVEPAVGSLAAGAAGLLSVALLRPLRRRASARIAVDGDSRIAGTGAATPGVAMMSPHGGAQDVAPSNLAVLQHPEADGHAAPASGSGLSPASPDAAEPVARPIVVLLPYVYLLIAVMAVFVPSGPRGWVKSHLLVGPSFGATETSFGLHNPAVATYSPIAVLGHPGSYILLASVIGVVTYRLARVWPRGELRPALGGWVRQAGRSSLSVIGLATVATVMVDAGLVRMIAIGVADVAGAGFAPFSPLIGMVGSFTTGSTTSSNALFAALQRDIALLIDVRPSELLAAQTAGGNVGNALAPVVVLIGATAVGAREEVRTIFRSVLGPAAVLVGVVMAATVVLVALR